VQPELPLDGGLIPFVTILTGFQPALALVPLSHHLWREAVASHEVSTAEGFTLSLSKGWNDIKGKNALWLSFTTSSDAAGVCEQG
jgi:hypothetical protein